MKHDRWHMTHDTWTWHVKCEMWHITRSRGWTFSQNVGFLVLTVWESQSLDKLINYKGVCRTDPPTQGLLIIYADNGSSPKSKFTKKSSTQTNPLPFFSKFAYLPHLNSHFHNIWTNYAILKYIWINDELKKVNFSQSFRLLQGVPKKRPLVALQVVLKKVIFCDTLYLLPCCLDDA